MSISLPKRAAIFAATIGVTAAAAGPALAATTPGADIYGSGSSLQKLVQQNLWTLDWTNTPADHAQLSNDPTATYTSSSSGDGLAEFGNTTGTLDPTQDPTADAANSLDAYVGTDDPPTPANLTDATTAAGAGIQEVTVPVAQAPVAVLLSLPLDITVGAGTKINLSNGSGTAAHVLQNIWDATIPASSPYPAATWGSLLQEAGLKKVTGTPAVNQFSDTGTAAGKTGGYSPITLQVRSSSSGTSYTFKGFLYLSKAAKYTGTYVVDADTWPVTTVNTGNAGGSNEVADTTATPGSVGYANLADAVAGSNGAYSSTPTTVTAGGSHQIEFAEVQDNEGSTTAEYANPRTATGVPNVYKGTNIKINGSPTTGVGQWIVPSTATGSWSSNTPGSGTLASDPDVYGHGGDVKYYPIVAATFDLGWTSYTGGNLASLYPLGAAASGASANSLLTYIVNAGQSNVTSAEDNYSALPSAIDTKAKSFVSSVG